MNSLLMYIEKFKSGKEDHFVSKELPGEIKLKLLRWYDGNIFNVTNERVSKALEILEWCHNKSSEIDYLSRDIRDNLFNEVSQNFNIPRDKLVKLFNTYSKLLFPSERKTKIIAFEGIDGSGKTLQIGLLEKNLQSDGKKVTIKSFPVYDSFFGENIGQFLSGSGEINANDVDPKSMSLWYALDRWKNFENFNYSSYDYLLLNRFTLSSAVYQSSRVKPEFRSEFIHWIFDLEHNQLGLPAPDLYIVFDLNAETSRNNISNKGFRDYVGEKADVYEGSSDIMNNARKIYQELAQKYSNIVIINCLDDKNEMKTPQEINNLVMKVVEDGQY